MTLYDLLTAPDGSNAAAFRNATFPRCDFSARAFGAYVRSNGASCRCAINSELERNGLAYAGHEAIIR